MLGQEIEDAVNHDEKLLPTFFLFLSPILHVSGMREETPWRHHGIKSTSPMRFLQGEALAVIYTVQYLTYLMVAKIKRMDIATIAKSPAKR